MEEEDAAAVAAVVANNSQMLSIITTTPIDSSLGLEPLVSQDTPIKRRKVAKNIGYWDETVPRTVRTVFRCLRE